MTGIRELVSRYPIASAAAAVALLVIVGDRVYRAVVGPPQVPGPPAQTLPAGPATPGKQVPGTAAPGVNGTRAPGGTPAPGVTTPPSATPTPGGPPGPSVAQRTGPGTGVGGGTLSPGAGRSDPFIPVVPTTPGPGTTLPPVPPLAPGLPGPGGLPLPPGVGGPAAPPLEPEPPLRLVGIVWDRAALAIVEDGKASYVVGPGDVFGPGTQVVLIDVRQGAVRVLRSGIVRELMLRGGVAGK